MAVAVSTDMSTTGTIRGTGIVVRRRRVATGRSTTSRAMRLGMDGGILGMPGIAPLGNIALGLSEAAVVVAAAVVVGAAAVVVGAAAAGTR
jgi:hypothetical protein